MTFLDPSLDPRTLGNGRGVIEKPFPKINRTIGQQATRLVQNPPGGPGLPQILGRKLGAPTRQGNVLYPVVLVGVRATLDDVPGVQSGQVYDLVRPCLSMRVENNGHREADTADVTLNFLDFPFDPRVVKDALVHVWVDYVDGLLMPTTAEQPVAKVLSKNAKMLFEGYADDYTVNWGNDGLEAKFKCRDYTGLLIDTKIMEGHFDVLRGNEKFTTIVKKLCQAFKIQVVFSEGLEAASPKVSEYFDDKDNRLVEESSSYWDVILKLADMLGCITFIFGNKLYFGKPDPFKVYSAMYDATSRSYDTLFMVWGENIESLEMVRKFGSNHRWTNVEILSYDEKKKKQIAVYWPPEVVQRRIIQVDGKIESRIENAHPNTRNPFPMGRASKAVPKQQAQKYKSGPNKGKTIPGTEPKKLARPALDGQGGGTVETEGNSQEKLVRQVYRLFAPNNVPEKHLVEMAKGIWQNLARNEITGKMKTQGHAELVVGNAFQISLSQEHDKLVSSYPDAKKRAEALMQRGFSKSMANQMARAYKEWTDQWWYIMNAVHSYTEDNGYDCEIEFISFANLDTAGQAGASTTQPEKKTVGQAAKPTTPKTQQQPPNRQVPKPAVRAGRPATNTSAINRNMPVGSQQKNPQHDARAKQLRQDAVNAYKAGKPKEAQKALQQINNLNKPKPKPKPRPRPPAREPLGPNGLPIPIEQRNPRNGPLL